MATFMHAEDFDCGFSSVRYFAHCDGLVLAPRTTLSSSSIRPPGKPSCCQSPSGTMKSYTAAALAWAEIRAQASILLLVMGP
ncbi:hypothetical protein C2845_PM11G01440 [Panicum miliaceum]|uniref:Uncharacterized protein n=1 Tax=Panicum miliaceum TaxID=4540 RepID=A0A3L6RNJ7_PANMI|nr:hypothetical protein C2845_PM11G01440 [Panicum miliaceum]